MNSTSLLVDTNNQGVRTLTLNRPQKHNAFDAEIINLLLDQLSQIENDESIRVVVLTGNGKSFSSGADLEWMRSMKNYDEKTNQKDALQLALLMRRLHSLNKPTIARVNGSAYGGALGLIACCDIAIAVNHAIFSFSEVRLGILPAVIAPYILTAIGARQTTRLFLTADKFDAEAARSYGLVHQCVDSSDLDSRVAADIERLLLGGPTAQMECKKLIHRLNNTINEIEPDVLSEYTSKLIAKIRTSEEGQEGLSAFLNKSKPSWINSGS